MLCNCGVFFVVIGIVVGIFGVRGFRRVIGSGCGCVSGDDVASIVAARVNCVWVMDVVSWHWRDIVCGSMLQLLTDARIHSARC